MWGLLGGWRGKREKDADDSLLLLLSLPPTQRVWSCSLSPLQEDDAKKRILSARHVLGPEKKAMKPLFAGDTDNAKQPCASIVSSRPAEMAVCAATQRRSGVIVLGAFRRPENVN